MKGLRQLIILGILLMAAFYANSMHIKGGWMYYEYLGKAANGDNTYKLVVKLYRDCTPPNANQNDTEINISIFKADNSLLSNIIAPQTNLYRLEKSTFSDCINPRPQVCYVIIEYTKTVNLPPDPGGYVASFQRCCRVNGIVNVAPPSNTYGNTYTISLPGSAIPTATSNNSPLFAVKDTAVVCYNSPMVLDYSATDPDGDSLVYSFTSAIVGASQNQPSPGTSTSPPYSSIPYQAPYGSTNPFGTSTAIDSKTGIITGTSPSATGEYVLSVAVQEYRGGQLIATTRKELHVNVAACSIVGAQLPGRIMSCDGYTVLFNNLSSSPAVNSYYWDFGEKNLDTDTSTQPKPTHTYSDTGVYIAKLVVNKNTTCADSATTEVRVFPGFFPDFNYVGSCFSNPFQFNDLSTTRYGVINKWRWNFGDNGTLDDTSLLKRPTFRYPFPGDYTVNLEVESDKGCADTISKQLLVLDKPLLELAFKDTLICSIDSLVLKANGIGNFSWSPTNRMINGNTATPTVFPLNTTQYTVSLNDRGCLASDTVLVNVLDFITVNAGNDTTICRTDDLVLTPVSQGLQYHWTPSTGLNNPNIKNPVARPLNPVNNYTVTVNLGKCQASDNITIRTVPYPLANAGADTAICFNDSLVLRGTGSGNVYTWSPAATVQFPEQPISPAFPKQTTTYILNVYENAGCPKPGIDSVLVRVIQPLFAFAGRDTSVVIGQPLQLNASSNGTIFNWTPSVGMNNTSLLDPVVVLGPNSIPGGADQIRYVLNVTTADGCVSSDDIVIRLFTTIPSIFVPNAFTPNADGKNDYIRPLLAGMKQLNYFRIYNRYGSLLFETKQEGRGWNGTVNGEMQNSGAYVYSCQAVSYTGNSINQSGTIVLIR